MKKILLALVIALCSIPAFSQNISVGLKAGVNIANFSGGDFRQFDKKSITGFHAGGFLNIGLGGISVQPEILISSAGARLDSNNGNSEVRLTYLAVPVMLKYRTLFGLYLEAGPQFSFKLGEDIGDMTINNFAKGLDLSLGIGAGISTKRGLGIGARYTAGISKVGDFNATDVFDPDFKNSILMIGISFPLGGGK